MRMRVLLSAGILLALVFAVRTDALLLDCQDKALPPAATEPAHTPDDANSALSDIENIVKNFLGVEDLTEAGENGKMLKELLGQNIPENAENIKIVEDYGKNGEYTLKISYQVQGEEGIKVENTITLQGRWKGSQGLLPVVTITPEKLTFEQHPLEGVMVGGGVIYEFTFTPQGIEYNPIW